MATRFYYIFLKHFACLFLIIGLSFSAIADSSSPSQSKLNVNAELFELGLNTGVISLQDFPSALLAGAQATFRASEDYFLQYNYLQTDIDTSSFENNPSFPEYILGEGRVYRHYNLLVGYNIFQGEFFASGGKARLSNLYAVAGIGDTNFGDEKNFTYVLGLGYSVEFARRYALRLDYRSYIYRSAQITQDDSLRKDAQFSVGLGYMF